MGTGLSENGKLKKEVNTKLQKAGTFFQSISNFAGTNRFHRSGRKYCVMHIFLPILTYGVETRTGRRKIRRERSRVGYRPEIKFKRNILVKTRQVGDKMRN